MAQVKRNEWDLPHLRTSWTLNFGVSSRNFHDPNIYYKLLESQLTENAVSQEKKDFWSVKFYPYTEPGVDPVFAVVGSKYIIICRPPAGEKESDRIEEIQLILDEEDKADNYHCTWTKDSETGTPLLCVAGANAKIKIYDVVKGTLVREIAGHGGDINSLEVSPTNPQILASASTDSTIRIWSLDPAHAHQPCAAILAGGGHKENILTLAWHETGQYLLSGGVDHIINLWTIPELPNEFTGTDKPTKIHYPHFSTSEVHSEIVDCITFYNDLIISKAEKDSIVVWSIVGFSSSNPPPPPASAPTMHDQNSTRSSFAPTPTAHIPATVNTFSPTAPTHQQFTRLFQFQNPDSNIMFTRFGFFPAYDTGHAILAMCTRSSKVLFWDLARLEEYSELTANDDDDLANKRPAWLVPLRSRPRKKTTGVPKYLRRETSPSESTTSASTEQQGGPSQNAETQSQEKAIGDADMKKSRELWDSKYDMGDSLAELKPHKEEVIRQLDFVGRQVAWSVGGEWCCVVGSASVIALFQRWGGK